MHMGNSLGEGLVIRLFGKGWGVEDLVYCTY